MFGLWPNPIEPEARRYIIRTCKKMPGHPAGFETSDNLFYTTIWAEVWLQLPGPAAPTTFTAGEYDTPGVSPLKV